MEAIKTYLETMFKTLPQNEESFRLKNELLISMEEKYNELKNTGKSENEAIGTVISEFGSIDELTQEMGFAAQNDKIIPIVELSTAQDFLRDGRKTAFNTAAGVFLVITGVAALIGIIFGGVPLNELGEGGWWSGGRLAGGISALMVFVAVGAAILAATWLRFYKYEFFQKEFRLPEHVRQYVNKYKEEFAVKRTTLIVAGVVIVVISTLAVIVPALVNDGEYLFIGISAFLGMVAVGACPLIVFGITEMCIQILLGTYTGDTVRVGVTFTGIPGISGNKGTQKMARIIGTISAFYWPMLTAAYLLSSFLTEAWNRTWLIWPIGALVFGAVSGAIGAYYALDEKK